MINVTFLHDMQPKSNASITRISHIPQLFVIIRGKEIQI